MGDEQAKPDVAPEPEAGRDRRYALAALAGTILGLAVLFSAGGVVSRPGGDLASLSDGRPGGMLARFGGSSIAWTKDDLLASPNGRLRSGRVLVTPLTCDRGGDRSTWLIVLARRIAALDRATAGSADAGGLILRAATAQAGKPLGTLSALRLPGDHPLRRTGIVGLVFVCASPSQTAQQDEIVEISRSVVRRARQEALAQGAVQTAIPRLPFKLDASGDSRDRGAAISWRAALAEAVSSMRPGQRLEVVFGLYALGDGGRRNRETFAAAAGESLQGARPELSRTKTGLALGGVCFAAGAAMAWLRRRGFTLGYLAALLALAATGAAGLLTSFALGDLSGFGAPPMVAFAISFVLMAAIGLFAEQTAGFDWRKRLGAAK